MKRTNEVSELVGVSRRTLQYYDDEGVLTLGRTGNNHRLYDKYDLERIWQILIYKEMGFKLKEIKTLFQMSENEKNAKLKLKKGSIENEINALKGQLEFISLALEKGIPQTPEKDGGISYVKSIEKLRQKLDSEILEK